jgi:hypothetical protein
MLDVSISEKTFKMSINGKIICGSFDTAISASNPVQVPKTYQATMNVVQKIIVADGQEEVTYFLLRLEPAGTSAPLLSHLR